MGQALIVQLNTNQTAGSSISVMIEYQTMQKSNALSWMTAAQTYGKVLPYMYSQCEDINCRSLVPVQDTPSNKVTYSARVETNSSFTIGMSANQTALNWMNDEKTE